MKKIKDLLSELVVAKGPVAGDYSEHVFDDLQKFYDQSFLPTGVWVRQGDVIDSIELTYGKKDFARGKSPFFHGGPNGYDAYFELPIGDFIRKIEVEYGKYPFSLRPSQRTKDQIIRIRFTTSSGLVSSWYGNICGKGERLKGKLFTIDAGENNVICCLYGSTGLKNMELHNYLQSLGVHYISFLDAKKILGQ